MNTSFGGEGPSGSYHTLYDTYAHYTRFRDPGLRYGVALAELNGRATLRLAQAPLLPFEFEGVAAAVDRFLSDLEGATEKQRTAQQQRAARLKDGSYALALDPEGVVAPPEAQRPVPYFNFAPCEMPTPSWPRRPSASGRSPATLRPCRKRCGPPSTACWPRQRPS